MAAETVVSDHPTLTEQVKEEVVEQVRTKVEDPEVALVESKDMNGDGKVITSLAAEEEELKMKEDPSPSMAPLPITEETCEEKEPETVIIEEEEEKAINEVKIHDKKETQVDAVVEAEKSDVDEKLSTEDLPSVEKSEDKETEGVVAESTEKSEDEEIETRVVEEINKIDVEEAEDKESGIASIEETKTADKKDEEEKEAIVLKDSVPEMVAEKKEEEAVAGIAKVKEDEKVDVKEIAEKKQEEQFVAVSEISEKKEYEQIVETTEKKEECLKEEGEMVERKEDIPVKEAVAVETEQIAASITEEPTMMEEVVAEMLTISEENTISTTQETGKDEEEETVVEVKGEKKEEETIVSKEEPKKEHEKNELLEALLVKEIEPTTDVPETVPSADENAKEKSIVTEEQIYKGAIEEPIKIEKEAIADATKTVDDEVAGATVVKEPMAETMKDDETTEDVPKEEVVAKSTQKQSNSIIRKMKKSLIKAKKAIIGKTPNSKTPPLETKDEDKV